VAGIAASSSTSTSRWIEAVQAGGGRLAAGAQAACTQRGRVADHQRREGPRAQRGDVGGLLRVARAQDDDVPRLGAGTAGGLDPGARGAPERDADRHVGRLAGGGRAAVVDVDVAVEVCHAHRARGVAQAGQGAGDQRAAAAEHQRSLAGRDDVAHGRPDGARHGEHVRGADDPGLGVAGLAADPHVEVAGVAGADPLEQPPLAHGGGRVLGAAGTAHGVDRDPKDGEIGFACQASPLVPHGSPSATSP